MLPDNEYLNKKFDKEEILLSDYAQVNWEIGFSRIAKPTKKQAKQLQKIERLINEANRDSLWRELMALLEYIELPDRHNVLKNYLAIRFPETNDNKEKV